MGSRIKSFFFGKSSSNGNANLRGQSYDSAIALDPPLKGSYPVAGNGPNVLEEIQRTRAKRLSTAASVAPAPSVSRRRDDTEPRPRTAPHNGEPGGGIKNGGSHKRGRTMSGFSMKSPPSIFNRRSSVSSVRGRQSGRTTSEAPPPLPASIISSPTEIRTYQPTGSAAASIRNGFAGTPSIRNGFVSPPPPEPFIQQHSRTASHASHKSYVDLLDAHSNVNRTREASKHRAKASGVRNYGEDVADRNIAAFGDRADRDKDHRLDLNSPEFSYLKQVYSPKKRSARETHSRVGSALGHVLGSEATSDDTHSRVTSIRSFSGPRPGSIYPPRIDSVRSHPTSINGRVGDDHSIRSNSLQQDHRGRALSPLSSAPVSIIEESHVRDRRKSSVTSTQAIPTPPIPERGRARAATAISTESRKTQNPPPVLLPSSNMISTSHNKQSVGTASKQAIVSTNSRVKSASPTKSNGGTSSRKRSASYSAFPSSRSDHRASPEQRRSNTSPVQSNKSKKREAMVVEGVSEPSSLEGVVDLKDSVDTDVTAKMLPAVVHEHITPTRHEIRKEVITREIHTHDVYHRILPVYETEILPTKHYVHSKDGKLVEIPESQVPKHSINGKLNQNWHIAPGPTPTPRPNTAPNGADMTLRYSSDSAPDGPVIRLARGDPKSTRPRGNTTTSMKSHRSGKSIFEPILSSKKESITKDGHPKTEYVWRHPPVFETATGKISPALIPAAFEGEQYYSDEEDDFADAEFGAERGEGDLLFRDSGYGSGGMLPGLPQPNPANASSVGTVLDDSKTGNSQGKVKNATNVDGEATKGLRRLKDRRRSSAACKGKEKAVEFEGVAIENRVRKMSLR